MALMYQSCVNVCSDLSLGVIARKNAIDKNFIYSQSQRTNQQVLRNEAIENNRH